MAYFHDGSMCLDMNQAANAIGLRKARYRGHKKVELEHYLGATAINITRLDAYFTHHPLNRTHTSRLIRLHTATMNSIRMPQGCQARIARRR
jgi:hypothetical protein